MTIDDKIGAVSVDALWVSDKLSEYGFTVDQLEALYPSAEIVAREWAARGDARINIDLVTGEMKRRYKLSFSNTVRPFLARMLRDRRPELRPLIKVNTTSRGSNKNLKVVLDHLDVDRRRGQDAGRAAHLLPGRGDRAREPGPADRRQGEAPRKVIAPDAP